VIAELFTGIDRVRRVWIVEGTVRRLPQVLYIVAFGVLGRGREFDAATNGSLGRCNHRDDDEVGAHVNLSVDSNAPQDVGWVAVQQHHDAG